MTPFVALQAAAAGVALARLARGASRLPPLEPVPAPPGASPCVSVVIPARDEEHRLGPCLDALAGDPLVAEVIVVDDESSDATAEVAARRGARVVTGRPLPDGWVGKPWALQQGLRAATAEVVLTLDADTRPRPGLVGALLAAAEARKADVVSVGGRFVCDTPGEQVLHPAFLATLVYRFGPAGPATRPAPGRTMANGQCLLARRAWLLDRGGFAPARSHMTDDIALARHLAATGAAVEFLDGTRVLDVDMHADAAEVWREWGRSLAMADVTAPFAQAADVAVVWLAMALPLPRLLARRGTPLDALLLAVRLGVLAATASAYRQPRRLVWLSPAADVAAAARLTSAALRPSRRWRGRTYPRARTGGR